MISIFSNLVEQCMEIFMDDFLCLDLPLMIGCVIQNNVRKVQGEKFDFEVEEFHYMVKKGIILGHIISIHGIVVDKAEIDLVVNLSLPTCIKEVRSFLGHVGFYRRFIKDFSKIAKPFTNLLAKDAPFHFFESVLWQLLSLWESQSLLRFFILPSREKHLSCCVTRLIILLRLFQDSVLITSPMLFIMLVTL